MLLVLQVWMEGCADERVRRMRGDLWTSSMSGEAVVGMRTSPPLVVDVIVVGPNFVIFSTLRPDWKMHR